MSASTPTAPRTSPERRTATALASSGFVPPPAPKLRRRPVMIALSIALVVLGSLGGVWAWTASTSTTEVVAIRTAVSRGAIITAQDLMVVRVNADPALQMVPESELDTLVGLRADTDLVAGTLVSPAQVTSELPPASGESVVGVPLDPGQLPGEALRPGDHVRLVHTPGSQGELAGEPVTLAAEVLGVHQADARVVVDLLVPAAVAPDVAARAGSGRVAIVLDARER